MYMASYWLSDSWLSICQWMWSEWAVSDLQNCVYMCMNLFWGVELGLDVRSPLVLLCRTLSRRALSGTRRKVSLCLPFTQRVRMDRMCSHRTESLFNNSGLQFNSVGLEEMSSSSSNDSENQMPDSWSTTTASLAFTSSIACVTTLELSCNCCWEWPRRLLRDGLLSLCCIICIGWCLCIRRTACLTLRNHWQLRPDTVR